MHNKQRQRNRGLVAEREILAATRSAEKYPATLRSRAERANTFQMVDLDNATPFVRFFELLRRQLRSFSERAAGEVKVAYRPQVSGFADIEQGS